MAAPLDLVIVGLGAAGTAAAEFASGLGLRAAAVDPLDDAAGHADTAAGAALTAAAALAHAARHADRVGLAPMDPDPDLSRLWQHLRAVRAASEPHRRVPVGIELVRGRARLTGPHEVAVGDRVLAAESVLVCTGSRPTLPDVDGLAEVGALTPDALWALERPPARLLVAGADPPALELAQALARLGVEVTLVAAGARLLPGDEPELVDLLTDRLRADGVTVEPHVQLQAATRVGGRPVLSGRRAGRPATWSGAELLATTRRPDVEGLDLQEIGVEVGPDGVAVDDRGRTAVPSVFAAGDVTGGPASPHAAAHGAVRALRTMFPSSPLAALDRRPDVVAWCTATDPELARAGATVAEAEARHGDTVEVWRHDVPPAAGAGPIGGRVLLVTGRNRLVGAHLLAHGAGELVHELALAVRQQLRLTDVAALAHVPGTLGAVVERMATGAASERAGKLRWIAGRRRR
ncbi:MAG: NAD(P)/FAD-dependent oxidoreductase [Acidimicrobiales bacterium]|nr:NAD(P)/FAD-dependent oxidoreductase [Acidimicrobiales bacterium]